MAKQGRRTARGDLQPVEAAPGDPHHADRAVAPGLCGQPRDHLQRVVLLLGGIFVEQQPIRLAAAPDVDAHAGVAVAGDAAVLDLDPGPKLVGEAEPVVGAELLELALVGMADDLGWGLVVVGHVRAEEQLPQTGDSLRRDP